VPDDRLARQIGFLVEADKLKQILRRTPLVDASRQENSAEHSWHMILAAMIAREYVPGPLDLPHAIELMAVHDLVEIDAGDTFAYDAAAHVGKDLRERAAADRIFGLLPPDQASRLRALWEEFEAQATSESRFANAIDRLQPLLQNAYSGGGSWSTHDVSRDQVLRRMAPIEATMPALWPFVVGLIDSFCASGKIRAGVGEPLLPTAKGQE
jgi:putative hydrolase of HD superfamily